MYTPTHSEANDTAGLLADFKITLTDVLENLQFNSALEFDQWQHGLIIKKLDEYARKEEKKWRKK